MSLLSTATRERLLTRLLALDYGALLRCMVLLLTRMGYDNVTYSGRRYFAGGSPSDGFDLSAYRAVPGGRRKVLIRVYQYPSTRPIATHLLNALRGACLGASAAEGVVITTNSFAQNISPADFAGAPVAPLRLIDGEYLTNLLALYRVGVVRTPRAVAAGRDGYKIDRAFFAEIAATSACLADAQTCQKRRPTDFGAPRNKRQW